MMVHQTFKAILLVSPSDFKVITQLLFPLFVWHIVLIYVYKTPIGRNIKSIKEALNFSTELIQLIKYLPKKASCF